MTTSTIAVGSICVMTLLASWRVAPVRLASAPPAACWMLSAGDLDLTRNDTRTIVSATDSVMVTIREAAGVPRAHEDSVRLYTSNPACDSAALVYDSLRASRGDTTGQYPIALFRIWGTPVYLGTVLDGIGGLREYVVFDSTFSVKGTLRLGS